VAEPADADFVLRNTKICHGFYGASLHGEAAREVAIRDQTRAFKTIGRRTAAANP
jgi:predicted TIM-barrel enzyme